MRYLGIALGSVLVVALSGGGVLYLGQGSEPSAPEAPLPRLKEEVHYYVLLDLVEVEPGAWDADDSAPDVFYRIRWQGHDVFRSETKGNTLVAKWSNAAVGLGDAMTGISIDGSIKAARITARRGDVLEFTVYDSDLAFDDFIGSWRVLAEELHVGDQAWTRPDGRVVMARCRVLPVDGVDFGSLAR